jgi:hypothetical protein
MGGNRESKTMRPDGYPLNRPWAGEENGEMKKKILYASPFRPMKSGISDYSEVLVYGLKEYFDISLLIDNYELENRTLYKDFEVKVFGAHHIDSKSYDYIIYNVGNNPHFHRYIYECAMKWPGMIILHDFVLYYLTIGFYRGQNIFYQKIYEMEGPRGIHLLKTPVKEGKDLLACKDLAPLLPLNRELINSGNLIMTHSFYTYDKVASVIDHRDKLRKVNHVEFAISHFNPLRKGVLADKYRIPKDCILVSSFGFVAETKLNHIICEVVDEINSFSDRKICYLMVGEGDYVDHKLNEFIIKTGYVDFLEFYSFIFHSDLIINLRYPSMGETSGSLLRILGQGRPCLVCDDAWFGELPDDVVLKLSPNRLKNELSERILYLLNHPSQLVDISANAIKYIKAHHSLKKVSQDIYEFLRSTDRIGR